MDSLGALNCKPPNNVAARHDSLPSGGSAVCSDCAPQLYTACIGDLNKYIRVPT